MITMRKLRTYWCLLTQNHLLHDDCMCKYTQRESQRKRGSWFCSNVFVYLCARHKERIEEQIVNLQANRMPSVSYLYGANILPRIAEDVENDIWPHLLATSNAHKVHNYWVAISFGQWIGIGEQVEWEWIETKRKRMNEWMNVIVFVCVCFVLVLTGETSKNLTELYRCFPLKMQKGHCLILTIVRYRQKFSINMQRILLIWFYEFYAMFT